MLDHPRQNDTGLWYMRAGLDGPSQHCKQLGTYIYIANGVD